MTDGSTDQLELAWFSALCDDDVEQLGRSGTPALFSSFEHCRDIALAATGTRVRQHPVAVGLRSWASTARRSPAAWRPESPTACGCWSPFAAASSGLPQLARQLATLDQMLAWRG